MVHHSHLEKEQKVMMCLQHKSVMLTCTSAGHDMKPVSHIYLIIFRQKRIRSKVRAYWLVKFL